MIANGTTPRERPLGDLMKDFTEDATHLVRQEIALAKAEIDQRSSAYKSSAGLFGAAAVVALAGIGALTAFLIAALDEAMPLWLAALIVGVVLLAVGGLLALAGRSRLRTAPRPVPEKALQGIKEDVRVAREGVRDGFTAS